MKLHYCFLKKFNNYFNRKIIKYNDIQDYIDHSDDSFIPVNSDGSMTQFDFNPNDNVITEIIVNDLNFEPDYFLLIDDESNIVSRWFVLEQKRNRNKQWLYHLRRDVIADNFNELLNAPIFVEKGMLREDDPFIVNDEGMSLNQIKKAEVKLIDKSRTAWIVGYLSKKSNIRVSFKENIDLKDYCDSNLINQKTEYRLCGTINHIGNINYGHYYAYIRIGEIWYEFNDSIVRKCYTMDYDNSSVCVLFYEKV